MTSTRNEDDQQSVEYSIPQKLVRYGANYVQAATFPYFAYEFLPALEFPYKGIEEAAMTPLCAMLFTFARWLTSEENPLDSVRAAGNGSLGKGMLRIGVCKSAAIGSMMALGYYGARAGFKYLPDLIQNDSTLSQAVARIIIIDSYRLPVMGTISYLLFNGIDWASNKIWECFSPEQSVNAGYPPRLSLLQQAGSYTIRLVSAVAMSETVLYYLNDFEYHRLAKEPHFQVGVILGVDLLMQLAKYVAYTPSPLQSLMGQETAQEPDPEQGAVSRNTCALSPAVRNSARAVMAVTLFAMAAFLINEIFTSTVDYPPIKTGELEPLDNRLTLYAVAFALPLFIQFVVEQASSRLGNCRFSLFQRSSPETQPLLQDQDVSILRDAHNGNMMKGGK